MSLMIYIAAPWKDRALMPDIARQFEDAGHTITHKWWQVEDRVEKERDVAELEAQAEADFYGVTEAHALVLLSTGKSEGKAVEQGIALAHSLPIVAIGKRGEFSSNVFHYMRAYKWVGSIREAIECLAILESI